MRLDWPPAKIRSKSYLNQLLIDFCDSIPAVRSIVATILIQIRTQILILKSILYRKSSILSKIGRIRPILIKFESIRWKVAERRSPWVYLSLTSQVAKIYDVNPLAMEFLQKWGNFKRNFKGFLLFPLI